MQNEENKQKFEAPAIGELGHLDAAAKMAAEAAETAKASASAPSDTVEQADEINYVYTWGSASSGNATADEAMKAIEEGINKSMLPHAGGREDSPYNSKVKISFLQHTNGVSLYKLVWTGQDMGMGIVFLDTLAKEGCGELPVKQTLISKVERQVMSQFAKTEVNAQYVDTFMLTPRCIQNLDALVYQFMMALNGKLVSMNPDYADITARHLVAWLNKQTESRTGRMITSSSMLNNEVRSDGINHVPGMQVNLDYVGDTGTTVNMLSIAVKPTFHAVNSEKGTIDVPAMAITDVVSCSSLTAPEIHLFALEAVNRELVKTNSWVHCFADEDHQRVLFEIADYEFTAALDTENLRRAVSEMFPQVVITMDEIAGYPQIAGLDGLVPTGDSKPCFMAYRAAAFFGKVFEGPAAFATDVDETGKYSQSSWIMPVGIEPKSYIDSRQYGLVDLLLRRPGQAQLAQQIATATLNDEVEALRVYRDLVDFVGTLPDVPQYLVIRHMISDAFIDRNSECMTQAFNWNPIGTSGPTRGVSRRVREASRFPGSGYRGVEARSPYRYG